MDLRSTAGRPRLWGAALVMVLAAGACRQETPGTPGTPGATPTPSPAASPAASPATPPPPSPPSPPPPRPPDLSAATVRLAEVARLNRPLAMAVAPGGAVHVAEKGGRVRALREGRGDVVLDISAEVSGGSEQGLLGLAFSPDGAFLYVNFTDRGGDTRVREYALAQGTPDRGSARQLLAVDQPYANHNGGHLVFGPDGNLWIGLGDGGSGGDPQGNAQDLGTLLGKMLRISPRPQADRPYGIPAGNPFAGRPGARAEIWSLGLRNPWRYSFDRASGDLWIGDVGQNAWEEVDFRPASSRGGENYGWNRLEGTHRFRGDPPPDHVPPIYEYARRGGTCAVTGGYVYRGSKIPDLAGAYVFGDYCGGWIRAVVQEGGRVTAERELGLRVEGLASFGEDAGGELYALSLQGTVYRLEPAS